MKATTGNAVQKVAIVTGASRGIGRAIAKRLATDGIKVLINYSHSEPEALALQAEIISFGGIAEIAKADITKAIDISTLFSICHDVLGAPDILINNAGVASMGTVGSVSEEQYDRAFAITKGVFFLLKEAGKQLNDDGRIINLSTSLTRGWAENAAAYAGSKAAIEVFTRSLSKELGHRGITVNAILPGVTETDMTMNYPTAVKESAIARSSLGRLGRPEDIADIAAFLASDDARWITGQMIVGNGGTAP
jgi:3-oxoacyl-[acyl-carrier protein] reductase